MKEFIRYVDRGQQHRRFSPSSWKRHVETEAVATQMNRVPELVRTWTDWPLGHMTARR
jgi:hypothetical protein